MYLQSTLLSFILMVCPPSTWFARLDGSSSLTYFLNLLHSVSWLAICWYSNSNSPYFLNKSLLIETSGLGPLNPSFQEATTAVIFLCGFSFKKWTAPKFYCCHFLKFADLSFKLSSHFTLFTHFLSLLFQWRMWKLLDKTPKFVHLAKKVHYQYIQRPHMYLKVNVSSLNQHVFHCTLLYILTLMWFPSRTSPLSLPVSSTQLPKLCPGLQILSPPNVAFIKLSSDLLKYKTDHISPLLKKMAHLSQDEFKVH